MSQIFLLPQERSEVSTRPEKYMSLNQIDAQKLVKLQQAQIESQARLIEILQKAIERQYQLAVNPDVFDDLI